MSKLTKRLNIIVTLLIVIILSLSLVFSKDSKDNKDNPLLDSKKLYMTEYYTFYGAFRDKKSSKKYIEFCVKRNKGEDYLYTGLGLNRNEWDILKFEVYNNLGKVWRLNPFIDRIIVVDVDDNEYESINLGLKFYKELRKKISESEFKKNFLITYKDIFVDHRTFFSTNFIFKGLLPRYEHIKKVIYRRALSPIRKKEKQKQVKYVKKSKDGYSKMYTKSDYDYKPDIEKESKKYEDISQEIEVYVPQYKDYVLKNDRYIHKESYK